MNSLDIKACLIAHAKQKRAQDLDCWTPEVARAFGECLQSLSLLGRLGLNLPSPSAFMPRSPCLRLPRLHESKQACEQTAEQTHTIIVIGQSSFTFVIVAEAG